MQGYELIRSTAHKYPRDSTSSAEDELTNLTNLTNCERCDDIGIVCLTFSMS